jgi:oligoendopeptidase F
MPLLEIKHTDWNLKPFFDDTNDPKIEEKRKEWSRKTEDFILKWKGRTDYLKDPKILKEALDDYEEWKRLFGAEADEFYYFWLKSQQDQNDSEIKARFNQVEEFSKKIENDMKFFTLNISKIPKKEQGKFLESPELKKYKHFLEKAFAQAKYNLSEKEEKIMNLKSIGAYSSWVKMLSGFLSKEERQVLDEKERESVKTFSDLLNLLESEKKEVRDTAAKAFNEILEKYADVAESEINAVLLDKKLDDELRGFQRPDKSRHIADDIDSKIIDSLIEAVSEKFSVSRRYYELKSKLLGIPKLEYHERNVKYGSLEKDYPYEDSLNLIHQVFNKLDKEFAEILESLNDNGNIDVYPKKDKKHGAFCVHFLKSQPTYLMLNHTNQLKDVLTIAHELGHAINSELMKEKQNSLNFDTTPATAEVASTFMEDFVLQELLKEADDQTRLVLLMQKLNDDISTIVRQIACYKFEQELHAQFREKGYLSKEEIGKLFQKHMEAYMGDYVEQSEGSENWWIHWSHIRTYFYNYSYASGLLISKALQTRVKSDPKFIESVKLFLSAGTSKSPKDIFLETGIDITKKEFWEEGLKEVENLLNEVETLAKKLGKI